LNVLSAEVALTTVCTECAPIAAEISQRGRSVLRHCSGNTRHPRVAYIVATMADRSAHQWSLYLLRCGDGSLYTGIATDVTRRLAEHEHGGGGRGAKYLRGRGPLSLVLEHVVGDRSRASRAERIIKRLPKVRKERLVKKPRELESILADL
jgi:putative endonuclease